jgi:hypothetical protein
LAHTWLCVAAASQALHGSSVLWFAIARRLHQGIAQSTSAPLLQACKP